MDEYGVSGHSECICPMRKEKDDKEMDLETAKIELIKLQRRIAAYEHATALLYYDGNTTAPKDTAANRAQSLSVLSEEEYRLKTCDDTVRLLEYLDAHKDGLSQAERRMVHLLIKNIRDMQKIPVDEYVEYRELLAASGDVWHRAKEASDFEMMRPYLEKVFATAKKFALYIEPDKDPYDHCLGDYEEGLTTAACDEFFDRLRSDIVPLIKEISEKPQIEDSIRRGHFPEAEQEKLANYLMEFMGLDRGHVGLSTTEHPFTTMLGSHLDERITTHFHEDDLLCAMYSTIHESGHALYDTGSADGFEFTVLDGGVSMSIHESQSRFYENIIGRSSAFCHFIFPKLEELFPEQMQDYDAVDLYRAVNRVQPSLIRTEADELTYSLHIMIRYELEKKIFAGELEVKDLPEEWNRLYKEYLGVDVTCDREGVLQDSHWPDGAIGYFPSYALGNAYGAQFLSKMKDSVDIGECIAKGDLGPVNEWNREYIWKHGCLYTPAELLERVLGERFDPGHYIEYLRTKMRDLYGIDEA